MSEQSGQIEMTGLLDQVAVTAEVLPKEELAEIPDGSMAVGAVRFGVTATGEPIGNSHWLTDSAVSGDMLMSLPSSVLVAGRTAEAGGVAVDMGMFLDAIVEGTAKFREYDGIAEAASLPVWAVCRLMGTFPVLENVYNEMMDKGVRIIEAAGMRAAAGMEVKNTRTMRKTKVGAPGIAISASGKVVEAPGEKTVEESEETLTKYLPPDPTLSKLILTNRMKGRYKDDGGVKQAIQINICGAEARL